MARLARYTQTLFGTSAGVNQMAEFGSFAAGSPATYSGAAITPAIIQTLSQYASGWFSAIVGANSPCIEDWNSLCYLFAYQLSYLMQLGVSEWDSATTYYVGSIVQDGSGNLYTSLTNANLNNAVSSTANWRAITTGTNVVAINPAVSSPYTMAATDNGKTFLVNSANGAMQFNLPSPATVGINFRFKVKDSAGACAPGIDQITFHRNAAENFEGLAADYLGQAPWGMWDVVTDGTNWFLI